MLGVPLPGVRVSVRDESGQHEMPAGTEGEIFVAGPNVFTGYVTAAAVRHPSDDQWSAGLPRAGEWLRTGDRGTQGADGTFSFRGLSKPMFTRNGFNIYPREIERVVRELPGVESARVSAIPDALRENDIRIDAEGGASAADVKAWCETRLSVYKRPSVVSVNGAPA